MSEMWSVVRSGGKVILAEHVASPMRPIRVAQRVLEPLTIRFTADHLLREPLAQVRALGFVVDQLERHKLSIVELLGATKSEGSS